MSDLIIDMFSAYEHNGTSLIKKFGFCSEQLFHHRDRCSLMEEREVGAEQQLGPDDHHQHALPAPGPMLEPLVQLCQAHANIHQRQRQCR